MKITFGDYIIGNTVKPGRKSKIGDVIKDSEGKLVLIGHVNIEGGVCNCNSYEWSDAEIEFMGNIFDDFVLYNVMTAQYKR